MRNSSIRNKLRSRKGASLTIALMLLLVTSTVTAVVLASAVTTAKREKSRKDTQQAMLTLQSAITRVRDQYKESTATIIKTVESGQGIPRLNVSFSSGPLRYSSGSAPHPLSEKTIEALETAYNLDCSHLAGEEIPTPVGSFQVSATVDGKTLDTVTVDVTILGNNHIDEESYMDFQIELVGRIEGRDERLDIKLDTDVYETMSSSGGRTITDTRITWRPEGEA